MRQQKQNLIARHAQAWGLGTVLMMLALCAVVFLAVPISARAAGVGQVNNLSVMQVAPDAVFLQWDAVDGADSYEVYQAAATADGNPGNYVLLGSVTDNAVTIDGQSGYQYYRVRAVKGSEKGTPSLGKSMFFVKAKITGIYFPTGGLTAPVLQLTVTNTSDTNKLYICTRGANAQLTLLDKTTQNVALAPVDNFGILYSYMTFSMCALSDDQGLNYYRDRILNPGETVTDVYIHVMGRTRDSYPTTDLYNYSENVVIDGKTYNVYKWEMSGTKSYGGNHIEDAVTNANSNYIPFIGFYSSPLLIDNNDSTEGVTYDKLWLTMANLDDTQTMAQAFKDTGSTAGTGIDGVNEGNSGSTGGLSGGSNGTGGSTDGSSDKKGSLSGGGSGNDSSTGGSNGTGGLSGSSEGNGGLSGGSGGNGGLSGSSGGSTGGNGGLPGLGNGGLSDGSGNSSNGSGGLGGLSDLGGNSGNAPSKTQSSGNGALVGALVVISVALVAAVTALVVVLIVMSKRKNK